LSTKLDGLEFYHDNDHQRRNAKKYHQHKDNIDVASILDINNEMLTLLDSNLECSPDQYNAFIDRLVKIIKADLPFRAKELFVWSRGFFGAKGIRSVESLVEWYHCPKGVDVGYKSGSATGVGVSSFLEVAVEGLFLCL
jgi:hypothetical protein